MPDPSTLLLLSCISSPSSQPKPVQIPISCTAEQTLHQDEQSVSMSPTCVSAPETLPTACKLKVQEESTAFTLAEANRSSNIHLPSSKPSPTGQGIVRLPSSVASASLQTGSQGSAVVSLQTYLKQLGYNPGPIDGLYGPQTRAAVIQFQQKQGLDANGKVGLATWLKLQRSLSQPHSKQQSLSTSQPEEQATTKTALPSQKADPSHSHLSRKINLSPPEWSLWLLGGWVLIYIGGWIWIFSSRAREVRGTKTRLAPTSPKTSEVTIEQTTANDQRSSAIVSAVNVNQQIKTSDSDISTSLPIREAPDLQTAESKPATLSVEIAPLLLLQDSKAPDSGAVSNELLDAESSSISNAQPLFETTLSQALEVIPADQGCVHPLKNLFIEPTFPNLQKKSKFQEEHRSTHQPTVSKAVPRTTTLRQSNNNHRNDSATLIAMLPTATQAEEAYTYSLVDDGAGLFVLRENQLWVLKHQLKNCQADTSTITVRRTNAKGMSVDKSFQFELKKMCQTLGLIPHAVRA